MVADVISLNLLAPVAAVSGVYGLIRCIAALVRVISPDVRHRFVAGAEPQAFALPRPGRYLISVVLPPFTFITGTAHFSARFSIRDLSTGAELAYRNSRYAFSQISRTDMRGRKSLPLGSFECPDAGRYELTCLNPDKIRSGFLLEIAPHISALRFVPLVIGTLVSAGMAVGGSIFTALWLSGRI